MKLPTLLSGPILRRVHKNEIYIWIATSAPYKIEAEIYEISRNKDAESFDYYLLNSQATTTMIQMGKKLFIHLIKIEPKKQAFPTETLLGYNLFLSNKSKQIDLGTLGLLSTENPKSIVYGNLRYPSFFINEKQESSILYGSCRKIHGDGEDALAEGDEAIWASYLNLEERPSSLFLVGDQIYADDVADKLAPYLFTLGKELTGESNESLTNLDERIGTEPYQSNFYKVRSRKTIMTDLCQFTSRNSDNHLITLGEYAAMYLVSWNPEIWSLFENETFKNVMQEEYHHFNYFINTDEKVDSYPEVLKEKIFIKQEKQIQKFIETLPQIRRLLANIPTYMIFDDHDLTDDWNISLDWKTNVWNAPLGRHVITNGLAAYWAFQGWGNEPANFNEAFLSIMRKQFSSKKLEGKKYTKWVKTLWGFSSWSFIAPTKPTAVFLDTRTERTYSEKPEPDSIRKRRKQTFAGPELVSVDAWEKVTKKLAESGWKQDTPLIVVSPVPFYGVDLIETFLSNYIAPLKLVGLPVDTLFDMEAWKYNGIGFTHFLRTIAKWNPNPCIILSGDAHTASSAISFIQGEDNKKMSVIQFTSSPLHNPTFSGVSGILLKAALMLFQRNTKQNVIHRSCDSNFHLIQSSTKPSSKAKTIWTENIRYLPMENGGLIKTRNNLGHLTVKHDNKINHQFLDKNSFD